MNPQNRSLSAAVEAVLHAQGLEVPVLLCQSFGALIAFFVCLSGIALCVASVSSVYAQLGGAGRWSRYFWLPVFWTVRWATGLRWMLAVLAILSLLLTSGVGVEGAVQLEAWVREVLPGPQSL